METDIIGAIISGDYKSAQNILEDPNLDINIVYNSNIEGTTCPFEDCYRFCSQIDIAKIISRHTSFDPNIPCVRFGNNNHMINILDFFIEIYESGREKDFHREEDDEHFSNITLFIDILLKHPKMLNTTIQNAVNKVKSEKMLNYFAT